MSAADDLKRLVKERPWLLALPVGVAVYFWFVRRPVATPEGAAAEDDNGLDGGEFTGREPGPAGDAGDGGGTPAPSRPTTNAQWEALAIDYLIGRGFPAAYAQTAIVKALNGDPLTNAEMSAVGLVLAAYGNPPEGMPPLGAAPPPTTPPGTPPGTNTPVPPVKKEIVSVSKGFRLADLPGWVKKYRGFTPSISDIERLNPILYKTLVSRQSGRFVKAARVRVR